MKLCVHVRRDEKGWFVAVCPNLPGCLGRGHTCQEAVVKVDDAIRGYVAALGNFVPEKVDHDVIEEPHTPARA